MARGLGQFRADHAREDIGLAPGTKASLRDLWTGKDLGVLEKRFEAKVGPHDVLMMRVTPIERGQ